MGLLKLAEYVLRRGDRKHREVLDDIDTSFHAGAIIRDELRKENESLRNRRASQEVVIQRLEANLTTAQKTIAEEQNRRQDLEAELRLWRRREDTQPITPTFPPKDA
jgi:uncharacterized coiled-coil protein SlyX